MNSMLEKLRNWHEFQLTGFQDAMRRVVESPGVKGTPEAERLKAKHIN